MPVRQARIFAQIPAGCEAVGVENQQAVARPLDLKLLSLAQLMADDACVRHQMAMTGGCPDARRNVADPAKARTAGDTIRSVGRGDARYAERRTARGP